MRRANPDPGFWRFIGAVRDACHGCDVGRVAAMARNEAALQRSRTAADRQRLAAHIREADSHAVEFPFHCCALPEPYRRWVPRGTTGIVNDVDVGGSIRTDGQLIRVTIHDATHLPGTYTVTVGDVTKSWGSLGWGSRTLEFEGCFGCVDEDFGIAWETFVSPTWAAPFILPTYSADVSRYELSWRWPQS
jgi:hypothetical protein